jgi:hypothetical protein
MNYARLKDILRSHASDFAEIGVPENAIDSIIAYSEITSMQSELAARHDRQYVLEYKAEGVKLVAQRHSISTQAARQRFNKIISKPNCMVSVA